MKKILSLILAVGLLGLTACQQYAPPVMYKQMTKEKSIALKSMTSSVMVSKNGMVVDDKFLQKLRTELRARGWKIIVDGFTGRAGETQSVNSGAAYTLIYNAGANPNANAMLVATGVGIPLWVLMGCPDLVNYVLNLSVVENTTGEEVLLLQGTTTDVDRTVGELVEQMDRWTQPVGAIKPTR